MKLLDIHSFCGWKLNFEKKVNGRSPEYIKGLPNKNGKEIYEGDIIKVKEIRWLVEPINSLEKDGTNYGLCVSPNGNGENYFLDSSLLKGEIIGNIYENPELLAEK